ncbi:MAG: hypothetical protein R3208_17005 [Ketobacteraceae bacterium]|nr:hypothetical protein [Ketobacteraceae bacterium]
MLQETPVGEKGASWFFVISLALSLLNSAALACDEQKVLEVRYPTRTIQSELSDYEKYWQGLLRLALEKSGCRFDLSPVDGEGLTHARIIRSIRSDGLVNVAYMGTSREFEAQMRPIRIPVFRGLIGYRILMIRAQDQPLFSSISNLSEFTRYSIGQGIKWSDVQILQDAGFQVIEMPYKSLFRALNAGRFQAISRAAHEIKPELALVRKELPGLAVEQSLILAFRQASFFFVAKDDTPLAEALEGGLNNAYDDGSFMAFYLSSPVVQQAHQILHEPGRRLFWIENNHLTPETRDLPGKYWFAFDN